MPLSAEQQQILAEVGDPNSTIVLLLPGLWTLYADKGRQSEQLIHLYAKRAALAVRLAEEQPAVDMELSGETRLARSQRSAHLQDMQRETVAEIVRIEGIVRASRPAAAGKITTNEPEAPPFGVLGPDAADPAYRGDAYRSSRGREP